MSASAASQGPGVARRPSLAETLRQRILILDGAMGTMIQGKALTAEDFGGADYEGCNEYLNVMRPAVIESIHDAYFEAGADIVETNTFGATSIVLAEYDLAGRAREINRKAAEIARKSATRWTTGGKPRFVVGSMGPTTKALTVTGGTTFDALVAAFEEQATGLIEGGVDGLLVETQQDTLNVKAACIGIERARAATGIDVPLLLSCTIEPMGTMLGGQGVEAFWASVQHFRPLTIGLNCATGPDFMTDHLRTLHELATCGISVYPNAGLPDENGHYDETPESFARKLERFIEHGWVNLVGGCCGTNPAFITQVARIVAGRTPRVPPATTRPLLSGIEPMEITQDPTQRPILVGERTNVIGSRKFKRLIQEGRLEEAAEVGRAQVTNGAQVVDVCLADPDRAEADDMRAFLPKLTRLIRAPLMIDSTDAGVVELALQHSQGKAIVNSINLEDGEERFERIVPLLRRYGAAVVVGCIDEDKTQGMAVTRARKLAVAERSFHLLTQKYGLAPSDIIFDPLVFPAGTGDANYVGSAAETIEGVRLVAERFPGCSTILGISNVSFGLPPAGREVLNSVFLYHCVQAGLTFAIVNAESLTRYPEIPEEERSLAEDLIFSRGEDPVARFTEYFRGRTTKTRVDVFRSLPLEKRLPQYIVQGTKDGLAADLDEALRTTAPLDIINGPLMEGMTEVGRLFNANELIVAEVLQSAEAMKAAVAHLEPHMEKVEGSRKGRILLATVKGDVHDIGKNLVDIILSNNGYEIVNLGIKVPPEELIRAIAQYKPDAVGLSGLLVKSAQQMVVTAEDLREAGVTVPLLVGGAALTARFTATRIAPAYAAPVLYAKDAMRGLALANALLAQGPDARSALLVRVREEQAALEPRAEAIAEPSPAKATALEHTFILPRPPDWARHALRDVDPRTIYPYVNKVMLFGKHLGLRGDVEKLRAQGDERAGKLVAQVEALLEEAADKGWIRGQAAWRFFPATAEGETLTLWDADAPGEKELARFRFPRQSAAPHRCLADFVRPRSTGEIDSVAMFVTTAGTRVRAVAEDLKAKGDYLRCHALQALAIETAEGMAEMVHKRIRQQWGILDDPAWGPRDLFRKAYRGVRVSFGYPACPDLGDQATLFHLLAPQDLGVTLTEGFMMDPEASVSALVFHHPAGDYFNAQ
ncbi:MAG: methionine synthase [Thermoplasmatota archaeon]